MPRPVSALACLLPLLLVAGACGGDDDDSTAADAAPAPDGAGARPDAATDAPDAAPRDASAPADAGSPDGARPGADAAPAADAVTGLPVGADCTEDLDCATKVCWDFHDYDPFCFGAVCSGECANDDDCRELAEAAGAFDPSAASCGADLRCDLVGTGLGAFACERGPGPF